MRIVIGTDTYPPTVNGAAQFSERLARGLAGRGHEVQVLCPARTARSSTEVDDHGVVVHGAPALRYRPYESMRICRPGAAGPAAAQLLQDFRPDVVHVQDHFMIGRALIGRAAASGIGVVATNHMMPENYFDHVPCPEVLRPVAARWLWQDLRQVFARADLITTPTPKAVELLRGATGLNAEAVSNGVDLSRWPDLPERAGGAEPPVVLFVGRLDPEKCIDDLIRAMALLSAWAPARLIVVGDGSQRLALRSLAADLGLGPDLVSFVGYVSDADLHGLYGRADIFCMPGVAELQSLATLEAMSAGLPIVAADAMALPHLVHDGVNGRLHPPRDVRALAAGLISVLADREERRLMGKRSREIVADHAFEATLDRFEGLYARTARSGPRPAARAAAEHSS